MGDSSFGCWCLNSPGSYGLFVFDKVIDTLFNAILVNLSKTQPRDYSDGERVSRKNISPGIIHSRKLSKSWGRGAKIAASSTDNSPKAHSEGIPTDWPYGDTHRISRKISGI